MSIKTFAINRLREPSTWRWFIIAASFFGAQFNPGQQEAIISAGVAVASALGMFLPDVLPEYPTMPDTPKAARTENSSNHGHNAFDL